MSNTRRQVEERLYEMVARDPELRAALKENPRNALATIFGHELPADIVVKVHEEDDTTVHLVLPIKPQGRPEAPDVTYCNPGQSSWSSCGYELSCYGPTCCPSE